MNVNKRNLYDRIWIRTSVDESIETDTIHYMAKSILTMKLINAF